LTQQCNKVYPNQLSKPEVIRLKELVQDARFQYWPVSSIAYYAMRNELLSISLNTWYKYVNKFGLQRIRPASRRKKNTIGIRADRPHQIWHADITIFETKDRIKQYIYLVVDNFSRKILSWKVAESVKASIRNETILDAIEASDTESVILLTDGGPENKFTSIQSCQTEINHKIALLNIHYSNSLVESHNKIIKYNYLYKMEISDGHQLHKVMKFVVDDFNKRPHISLNGLTPNEVEVNVQHDKIKRSNQLQCATEVRKIYNNLNHCDHCR
jgi:putative transposase